MPLTKSEACKIALSLPNAFERSYFGKVSIFVGEDFVCRIHDKEEAVVIVAESIEMRDMMLQAEPWLFYITEHYRNHTGILARLKVLNKKTLKDLLAARLLRIAERIKKKPRATKKKKNV